jgi:hypothetical protein
METPNHGVKMTELTLIKTKTAEELLLEEIEEIQLGMFDIIENNNDNWFTDHIKKLEEE